MADEKEGLIARIVKGFHAVRALGKPPKKAEKPTRRDPVRVAHQRQMRRRPTARRSPRRAPPNRSDYR